jgi:FkbM family methyltransferase
MIADLLRSLPPFKGKLRLARFLVGSKIKSATGLKVTGKLGCVYNLPNVKENIGFEILVNGIYEPENIKFIARQLRTGETFIDIGANVGAISIPISKLCQGVDVISVEASPWVFEYLKQNVIANGLNDIQIINKAMADKEDELVNFYSPRDKYGKGSMASVFTQEAESVRTISLDQLSSIRNQKLIRLIKIDVEGFEASVFRGGKQLLQRLNSPDVVFEFVDWAEERAGEKPGSAQSIMLDYGYKLFVLKGGTLSTQITEPFTKGGKMFYAQKRELK